jgi:hypothetical protein
VADGFIRVPVDDVGKRVDSEELTVSSNTVQRQRVQIAGTADVDLAPVSVTNGLLVNPGSNNVDSNNSSTTPLGISATFTGTATDVSGYGSVSVQVFADQASATDGLSLEWSIDGTNWDVQDQHDVAANAGAQFILPRAANQFRVVYTNGGTGQTVFRLETILNRWSVSGEIEDLSTALAAEDLALSTRAVIAGETPGGAYANVQVSTAGNFKIDVEELAGTTVSVDQGAADAGTQRVILANDEPLPAGTNNIGDVDVASTPADATDGGAHGASQTGFRVMGTDGANDQQIQTTAGGAVVVNDGGSTLSIDAASLPLPTGAATAANQLPDGHAVTVDNTVGAPANVQLSDGTDTALISAAGALNVDGSAVTQPISAASLPLPTGAATAANQLANGHDVTIDNAGAGAAVNIQDGGNSITVDAPVATPVNVQLSDGTDTALISAAGALVVDGSASTQPVSGTVTANAGTGTRTVAGDAADDAADTGNPVKIGFKAREFNTDPDTMSANNDRVDAIATPQGIQWVLGGHPNIINREWSTTAVQTDDPIVDTVAAGSQIVVTAMSVFVAGDATTGCKVRIGFGTANVPTEPASGASVDGMCISHDRIEPGSGIVKGDGSAAIFIGGDGEELRITCETPTPGRLTVLLSYYVSTL